MKTLPTAIETLATETTNKLIQLYPTSETNRKQYHQVSLKKKKGLITFDIKGKHNDITNVFDTYITLYVSGLNVPTDYKSELASENKFISKCITNETSYLKWVITHEYAHILYPNLGHTKEFFEQVEAIYRTI
ncbi:M48 family metallopeptidase [Flavobacterium sp. Sr18]|uniref:M48 family metallopeptidase n=1 Tax=Flavobacterium sp. Sr18 TaxID=935222 RepID=UPI0013E437FB|nr:M48 family metallopeptidase [Flavobacterium sp. Sr18]QIH37873.1 M48 family metallopeptidase [Flavobacterium sp. Sr18]